MLEQNKTPIFGTYGGLTEWYSPPRKGLLGMQILYEDMARSLGNGVARDGFKNVVVARCRSSRGSGSTRAR